jgi:hypothetical protein
MKKKDAVELMCCGRLKYAMKSDEEGLYCTTTLVKDVGNAKVRNGVVIIMQ